MGRLVLRLILVRYEICRNENFAHAPGVVED